MDEGIEDSKEKQLPWQDVHKKQADTPIGRFFRKIQGIIQGEPNPEVQLRTRKIKELQVRADDILNALETIKAELQATKDPELFKQLEAIIDPIIREVKRLQGGADDEQTLKRYTHWIEKATLWVNLSAHLNDKKAIQETLMRHIANESQELIQSDLKVISEYLNNALSALEVDERTRVEIERSMGKEVAPHITGLQQLKVESQHSSMDAFVDWRKGFDELREQHFNAALHSIDQLIQSLPGEGSDQVTKLKKDVEALLNIMEKNMEDEDRRAALEPHFAKLEMDLDFLNENADPSTDLRDRLNDIRRRTDKLHKELHE